MGNLSFVVARLQEVRQQVTLFPRKPGLGGRVELQRQPGLPCPPPARSHPGVCPTPRSDQPAKSAVEAFAAQAHVQDSRW